MPLQALDLVITLRERALQTCNLRFQLGTDRLNCWLFAHPYSPTSPPIIAATVPGSLEEGFRPLSTRTAAAGTTAAAAGPGGWAAGRPRKHLVDALTISRLFPRRRHVAPLGPLEHAAARMLRLLPGGAGVGLHCGGPSLNDRALSSSKDPDQPAGSSGARVRGVRSRRNSAWRVGSPWRRQHLPGCRRRRSRSDRPGAAPGPHPGRAGAGFRGGQHVAIAGSALAGTVRAGAAPARAPQADAPQLIVYAALAQPQMPPRARRG